MLLYAPFYYKFAAEYVAEKIMTTGLHSAKLRVGAQQWHRFFDVISSA